MARIILIGGVECPPGVGVNDDRREGRIGGRLSPRGIAGVVVVVTPPSRFGGADVKLSSTSATQAAEATVTREKAEDRKSRNAMDALLN